MSLQSPRFLILQGFRGNWLPFPDQRSPFKRSPSFVCSEISTFTKRTGLSLLDISFSSSCSILSTNVLGLILTWSELIVLILIKTYYKHKLRNTQYNKIIDFIFNHQIYQGHEGQSKRTVLKCQKRRDATLWHCVQSLSFGGVAGKADRSPH